MKITGYIVNYGKRIPFLEEGYTYIPGVSNLRLFEWLSVALDKCIRISFSFFFCYILKHWEDNIRMYLEEIGINASNWVDSAEDRNYWRAHSNGALNVRVP